MNRFTKKRNTWRAPGRMLWIVGVVLLVCVAAFFRMRSMMIDGQEDSYAATAQTQIRPKRSDGIPACAAPFTIPTWCPWPTTGTSYNVAFYRDPSHRLSEAYRTAYTQVHSQNHRTGGSHG